MKNLFLHPLLTTSKSGCNISIKIFGAGWESPPAVTVCERIKTKPDGKFAVMSLSLIKFCFTAPSGVKFPHRRYWTIFDFVLSPDGRGLASFFNNRTPLIRGTFYFGETVKMKKENNKKSNVNIRALCVTGIMSALGALLMLVEFPLPMLIPAFIKMDFSELPALITTYAFGPVYGVGVCFLKNVLHLISGSTMGIGELSN